MSARPQDSESDADLEVMLWRLARIEEKQDGIDERLDRLDERLTWLLIRVGAAALILGAIPVALGLLMQWYAIIRR